MGESNIPIIKIHLIKAVANWELRTNTHKTQERIRRN